MKKDITTNEAKQILENEGYYVDNLWHIRDVIDKYEHIDKEEAYSILDEALTSEIIQSKIFEAIDYIV